jgi:hypothetical protein
MRLQQLVDRLVDAPVSRYRRGGREAILWSLRLTAAAVASYVVADWLFAAGAPPLLAPLTALLVVQLTPVSLLASGVERVVSVVAGVLLAIAFAVAAPLTWWSLAVLIAASLLVGSALRLGSNRLEVPISAMLVLGVGQFQAESAAWQRVAETLVGAGVGVLSNLLFPPKVATDDASKAIQEFADRLAATLVRAADEMRGLDPEEGGLAARTQGWLGTIRETTHEVPLVGHALLRAEQSRRLNVRAVGTPDAGPGLRQGLEAVEHSAIAVRGMVRAVHDAAHDPGWPRDDVGSAVTTVIEHVFRDIAAALVAFGELVRAEAGTGLSDAAMASARASEVLDDLREARARLGDLLLPGGPPVLAELHFALLTTVKRLLRELDLEEREGRRSALRRPPQAVLTRRGRRTTQGAEDG